jgi:probable lipoprotein NlpC
MNPLRGPPAADQALTTPDIAQTANTCPRAPGTAWLDDYMRIPFRDRGRDAQTGCDCYGLARLILWQQAGIEMPAFDVVDDRAGTIERESRMLIPIEPGQELRFDFVVLRGMGSDSHLGLVTRPGWLVHTEQRTGPVHVPFSSVKCRLRRIYRHRELA